MADKDPETGRADIVRLGTRGSPLALCQAREVADALETLSDGTLKGEIVSYTTRGDQLTDRRLADFGGKGLFTRELDRALDAGEIDVAVHSLKDVPTELPTGQVFIAFPPRADPREAFLSPTCAHPQALHEGAVVGTSSLRREAQTRAMRPDLSVIAFRGSVQTRMRKLEEGQADATWLAMAGLERLGLTDLAYAIACEDVLPAAGQGIIACVTRRGVLSSDAIAAFEMMSDPATQDAAAAERAFLAELDGSCRTPIAAHLFREADGYRLRGEVLVPDGSNRWGHEIDIPAWPAEDVLKAAGREVGQAIRSAAGEDLPSFDAP